MSIIPKLEECLEDINPDYDPSKPMKSIDVERMEKVDYDLPVDVEENTGYWKGITMQGEPFDVETKSLKIHECKECAENWHKITTEQNFFPVDGSYCRIRREELHLIVTKAVVEPYNTKEITLSRIKKEHMLLFFIDKAILSEQALKKVVTKLASEDLKGEGPIYMLWHPEFRAVDQSTGLTTRLRNPGRLNTHHLIPRWLGGTDRDTIEICDTCHAALEVRFDNFIKYGMFSCSKWENSKKRREKWKERYRRDVRRKDS